MLESTREAARNVTVGTRALAKGERRPFRASGPAIAAAKVRSNVLATYSSRARLEAVARREAALARGRDRFIMESRLLAVGLPVGIAAGALAWRAGRTSRGRGIARFIAVFAGTIALTLLEARAEWRGMEVADDEA